MSRSVLGLAFLFAAVGCQSPDSGSPAAPAAGAEQAKLVDRGRTVFMSACATCHNSDPHKPGTIGPEIAGSSKELIEARVLRAEYPQGYKPKRDTHLMPALPHLKSDLDALHAFLKQ